MRVLAMTAFSFAAAFLTAALMEETGWYLYAAAALLMLAVIAFFLRKRRKLWSRVALLAISAAAALCAVRLCPNVRGYLVPSHASFEIGYRLAMEAMDLRPLFDLGMRLGEGSGCPLAFQVLDAACAVINDMATFDEAGINDDYLDEIRRGDQFTP